MKSNTKVTSNRGGLDAYFAVGPEIPFFGTRVRTTLLAFTFIESISIIDKAPNSATLDRGLEYQAAYLGGGIVLSW